MTRTLRLALSLLAISSLAAPARAQQAAPAPAAAPAIKPFETVQLTATAWYGRFGVTDCAWLDLGEGVLLVDAGGTAADTANVVAEVKRTTKGKPIRWIVLTHLHQDNNGGLPSLLPTDATIFANQRVVAGMAAALAAKSAGGTGGKEPTIVGVADRIFVAVGKHPLELFVPAGTAHSDSDLVAYAPELKMAFVGDLVTPGRCPIMTDASANPPVWLETLDRILALQPAVLIPARGDAAVRPEVTTRGLNLDNEVQATRIYIDRMVTIVKQVKKEKSPESRVSSELRLAKVGNYCPDELDAANGLALFRRLGANGQFVVAGAKAPAAKGAAPKSPAPKKK